MIKREKKIFVLMNSSSPHNMEAEQSVLGSMFLSKKALQKALELLNGSEFYLDSHAKIFECIKCVDSKGSVVDLTTVGEELNNRNWLKQIGDIDYLTEIMPHHEAEINMCKNLLQFEICKDLREYLTQNKSFIFTLIHKFIYDIYDFKNKKILL